MIITDIIQFLREIPPFQFLDEEDLARVASGVSIKFFPKNTFILRQDDLPSDRLIVIKKGGAKVFHRSDEGGKTLTEYCGEGGLIDSSLLSGSVRARIDAIATEDTICYLITKESMQNSVRRHDVVTEFLHKSFIGGHCSRQARELKGKRLMAGGGDNILFTITVGEIATKPVITASPEISIQEAAELMARHQLSSLILAEDVTVPVGIVTNRDLSEKVVAINRDTSGQVLSVMNTVLIKIDAREYCIEALLKMVQYDTRHLLVVDNGKLKGVITIHDLMRVQGATPFLLAREIESQHTIEGLARAGRRITDIVSLLIKEGAKACNIMYIISEINDRLARKVLEIAEKKFGHPPISYCFIALGSGGRGEQTLRAVQENAIIYADPFTPEEEDNTKRFFRDFIPFVNEGMERCGLFGQRPGGMAVKPEWCRPLGVWRRYFQSWITAPAAETMTRTLPFFDFRPVHGDFSLAFDLRDAASLMIQENRAILGTLANALIRVAYHVEVQQSVTGEESLEHPGEIDLMEKGADLVVAVARLFALECGIKETSTIERIARLRKMNTGIAKYADELEHAFEFIMLLKIYRQFELIGGVRLPDDCINPHRLDARQRKLLHEAFVVISKVRELVIGRKRSFID